MKDESTIDSSAYKMLSRIAFYIVLFAWIILGLYIFFEYRGFNDGIIKYFLSTEQSAIKFRALILLAPFLLTAISYLVNEIAKLFEKTLSAEKELRQRTIELEQVNKLLTKENIERRKAEELLTRQAFYDSLTNLPNRSLFMDHLRSSLERRKRYKDYAFAVLFLDVDRFKFINDSLGHVIGDHLLIMISQRLKRHIRAMDTIARFGGDEFAILMGDTKETGHANDLAGRIQEEMRLPYSVFGHEIFATVSIGIVLSNLSDYSRPDELLRDADTAMYNAKAHGKACHVIFDSTMHAKAARVLQLETDLRRAVEYNEFIPYYQPILSVENARIIGFEALVRWQHPTRGLIAPAEFIVAAEETGLILPMGKWIIRESCRQMRSWQEQFPEYGNLAISVNVSSKIFSQIDFYEMIEKILHETGLEGSCLKLEIVESMLIENPEPAAALIKRLKNLNVRFDIDDFGTGYSALNYLRHFAINGLKIDGSFINTSTFDKYNAEIVKTIIALGQALNLEVVAEGIETLEQLEQFRGMNGKYAQGFFLFRPMDSKAAGNLLREKDL